jgi:archaellum component FlaC
MDSKDVENEVSSQIGATLVSGSSISERIDEAKSQCEYLKQRIKELLNLKNNGYDLL